jgi:hypothetical protein
LAWAHPNEPEFPLLEAKESNLKQFENALKRYRKERNALFTPVHLVMQMVPMRNTVRIVSISRRLFNR